MPSKTEFLALRVSEELMQRIDRYAALMAAEMPGVSLTRADAVRRLVELALARKEGKK